MKVSYVRGCSERSLNVAVRVDRKRAWGIFHMARNFFTAIYASDLKRAFATAQALYDDQKDPKPSFESSELLRELNFGDAAGHPMMVDAD